MERTYFEKKPKVKIKEGKCISGWNNIAAIIVKEKKDKKRFVVTIECYQGVYQSEIEKELSQSIEGIEWMHAATALQSKEAINDLVKDFVTDDPVFGVMNNLALEQFFQPEKVKALQTELENINEGIIVVLGTGASLIQENSDLLIYADMPRREIELRFRNNSIGNLGADNATASYDYQYKRSFFVDWRVLDRYKRKLMDKWNYLLDTTNPGDPKMLAAQVYKTALKHIVSRPFRLVPYFDPGPWGGHWMKEKFDLQVESKNLAWSFDGVPEENTLVLSFEGIDFKTPGINLVFSQPESLLGTAVFEAFGAEFPIRFDLLDTMGGGNLSLQVHPLKKYMLEKFNMPYTQDESYYILDAGENAQVFLGFKEEVDAEKMMRELELAHLNGNDFKAEDFVLQLPAKKHDHFIIPSGTIHCSGANTMVLEISATPYIFTFKLWDWNRMDLNGKPRPISLEHGKSNLQWDRRENWVKNNLVNRIESLSSGDGWKEERTGLNPEQFIETRRIKFSKPAVVKNFERVNVLNLVDGEAAIIESVNNSFQPFELHYAETLIIPAAAGDYKIRPASEGEACVVIRAFVRTEMLDEFFSHKNSISSS